MNVQSINKSSNLIFHGNPNNKQIALTYDCDDLEYFYIQEILNTLKKHKTKATFFLTGLWTEKFSELAQCIILEGHEIGNHSHKHPNMTKIPYDEIKKSVIQAEKIIKKILEVNPRPLFRAPYGEWNNNVLQAVGDAGYKYSIDWSIDTLDWQHPPTKTIVERIFKSIKGGDIILMHGHGKNTAAATDFTIETLKAFDFKFVKVSELLKCCIIR